MHVPYRSPLPPHLAAGTGVTRVMLRVVVALVPGTLAMSGLFGPGVLGNLAAAAAAALACEAGVLALRRRPLGPPLADLSALVTALLLGLCLPPSAPWWVAASGAAFAVVFAKQLYGGLGHNPFNPAMAGYAVLLISFPREMTLWPPPAALSEIPATLFGAARIDGTTMATALDTVKTELGRQRSLDAIQAGPAFGLLGGRGWEWIAGGFLLGGLWLLLCRTITWHVPAATLGSLSLAAAAFHLVDPHSYPSPLFHLFSGGAMLGAFFIATDPVSGCASERGRLAFGAGVGLLTYVIRTFGGYPDGMAFAVLLMNLAAPAIDRHTRPRVFGEDGR